MSAISLTLALTCFTPVDPVALPVDAGMPATIFGIDLFELEQFPHLPAPVEIPALRMPSEDEVEEQREYGALSRVCRRTGEERTASRAEPPASAPLTQLRNRPMAFHPAHISRSQLFCSFLC